MNVWVTKQPDTVLPTWWGWALAGLVVIVLVILFVIAWLRYRIRQQTVRLNDDLVRLRNAEAELSQQRSLFRNLIQTIPDPVWLKDPDGFFLACNLRFEALYGARECDIIGKTDYDFVDREQADSFRNHDRAAMLASKPSVNEEWLTFAADGYHGLFETTKTPMADADGRVIGVLGIAHDITERVQGREALAQSEARFRRLVESAPDILYMYSVRRGGLYYSAQVEKLFGHSREYLYQHPSLWADSIHEDDRPAVALALEGLKQGLPFKVEYRVRDAEGQWHWLYDRSISSQQEGDDLIVEGLAMDISERKRQDKKLSQLNDSLEATLNAMPDLLFEVDLEGRYYSYRSPHMDLLAAPPEVFLGKTVTEILPPETARICMAAIRAANEEGHSFGSQIALDLPIGRHWFELSVARKASPEGEVPHFIVISRDITDRKQAEAQIEHMAYHDQLTELPNRALFLDRLDQALAAARRAQRFGAVMFVDLDLFKQINDVYGHEIGDAVLRSVAQRLRDFLRQGDTVARFGGDEFVVLLPELSIDLAAAASSALSVGEKLRVALEEPTHIDGQIYHITASIGVSLFPKQGESVEDLIREADIAMYRAKEGGRNMLVCFEQEMHAVIADRYALEQELRATLRQGGLQLFLQSQVDAAGKIIGAEALVRWPHPDKGLIAPASFIPVAEETGLIVDIGDWVLRESCHLIARLSNAGFSLRLAVNVSPRQFHQADFVTRVREVLTETGADPVYLTLEVTENLLLDRTSEVVSRMRALSELGIRFAIDDFGTGYFSLAYLKRLPLNELKIDKSFVQDVAHDANDVALVETILSMARHLGFEVVAVGVETQAQLEFLVGQGCEHFQGYYFHRPQPAQEWLARLDREGL